MFSVEDSHSNYRIRVGGGVGVVVYMYMYICVYFLCICIVFFQVGLKSDWWFWGWFEVGLVFLRSV